ncbi:pyridoxal-phosphate dependent enzyme [Propionivibrio dicarboxylicus]|uniref:Threonine synthase n=1 Tax=Propionivibrio dicarboxylicus TaxID=83767 RepID=A0A1G7WWC6_9RHOO|nr:pyridoxal-phosphate dependent enzyme [Propionivibrio dicarboxylicus]SDG76242.1 Threonine synthase [Propionivibrio dicarboxylicus]
MSDDGQFVCHGCGARVDAALSLPFRCPNADDGRDIDHLLLPADADAVGIDTASDDPFVRYRRFLSPYRLARRAGLSDEAWRDIAGRLDAALIAADGTGFRLTPLREQARLAQAIGFSGRLWVKDETGNVAGSHKARHLMGVMLYLRVLEAARLPAGDGLSSRRLAIASCGNAALAAAVIARAAEWPLDVFIPPDASSSVVRRLTELGATITLCERRAGERGDPCFLRFREAVTAGAIPFGVQGTENGLAIEGGRTLALEMAETFAATGAQPESLYVQIGGGALASGLAQGFALAARQGLVAAVPRLMAVQTAACAPLARAWAQLSGGDPKSAAQRRSQFMWAWENAPSSIASGILDDETYDWFEIVSAMRASGGAPVVAVEAVLQRAHEVGVATTGIRASATGTAGLAGLIVAPPASGDAAIIFSGIER